MFFKRNAEPVAAVRTKERESQLWNFSYSEETAVSTDELTGNDRCDRCSARAGVRAIKGEMELLFCGNHGRKNVASLISSGWKIDDQTHKAF